MKPAFLWPVAGAVILVSVLSYFGFQAVDAAGLADQQGTATVLGREHRDAATKYRTELIGGQTRVIPQHTPEMYIVTLRIGNQETTHAVDRALYDSLRTGDQLAVVYQQRRISGGLQVTRVEKGAK